MYYAKFYNKNKVFLTRINRPEELAFTQDIYNEGTGEFALDSLNPLVDSKGLDQYQIICEIYRDTTLKYLGIIQNCIYFREKVIFQLVNMMSERLGKRVVTSKTFAGDDVGDAIYELLSDTNTTEDTLIDSGVDTISDTTNESFSYETVLNAMNKLRDTANAQIFFDTDYGIDIASLIGYDRTNTHYFIYDGSNPNGNTVKDNFQNQYTGARVFTQVLGKTDAGGGLTSTQTNVTGRNTYGLLQKAVQFDEADNQGTLNAKTLAEVNRIAAPKNIPIIEPMNDKIDPDSYSVGDRVTVKIKRGELDIEGTYQIVQKNYQISDTGTENVTIALSEYTTKDRPSLTLAQIFNDLDSRINQLELT